MVANPDPHEGGIHLFLQAGSAVMVYELYAIGGSVSMACNFGFACDHN